VLVGEVDGGQVGLELERAEIAAPYVLEQTEQVTGDSLLERQERKRLS